jgi:hypothetical protein
MVQSSFLMKLMFDAQWPPYLSVCFLLEKSERREMEENRIEFCFYLSLNFF